MDGLAKDNLEIVAILLEHELKLNPRYGSAAKIIEHAKSTGGEALARRFATMLRQP